MAINSPFTVGNVLTAAQQNALPFGIVSTQTLVTTFSTTSTSAVNITGLSITFTAVANRRYICFLMANINVSTNVTAQLFISKGGTDLSEGYVVAAVNTLTTPSIWNIETPGAGSVTYQARMKVDGGTGTCYGSAARNSVAARMVVLDIGNT
jgi:hypothetical protein